MSETGPQEPTEPTIEVNPNVKFFLEDLPREAEGEKKHNVSILPGKDSCVVMFGFNEAVEVEQAVVIIKVLFEGENKQDLVIESIQVHSKDIKLYFSVDSLKILIEKAKGKFSRIEVRNIKGNTTSFWTSEELGFKKCEDESNVNDFELKLN